MRLGGIGVWFRSLLLFPCLEVILAHPGGCFCVLDLLGASAGQYLTTLIARDTPKILEFVSSVVKSRLYATKAPHTVGPIPFDTHGV